MKYETIKCPRAILGWEDKLTYIELKSNRALSRLSLFLYSKDRE
jgi:hypothetical protein